jgi:ribosomal protein L16 Arg81 hydroxylase
MNSNTLFTSHSKIAEYPPNPQLYPNFYHCKEQVFILNPGDMLYIPPKWFHWVFSYGDENRENLALGYNIFNPKNEDVYNEFYFGKPFVFNVNDNFDNISSLSDLNQNYEQDVFLTKSNTIVPVQKDIKKTIHTKMFLKDILNLHQQQTHNIGISREPHLKLFRDTNTNFYKDIIQRSFPKNVISSFLWLYLLKNNNTFVETGLHYDITHNILVQIKGTKLVRLYKPSDAKYLYLQPTYKLPLRATFKN